ncbi:MAG TPA: hypothetical protein VNW94_09040 [Streptosporangiaceae bacterium]|nr:hypothetical protein [Streptosporangiaceae bacterium]
METTECHHPCTDRHETQDIRDLREQGLAVAAGSEELIEVRRRHLAALAHELEARGVGWRLLGAGESILRAANTATGRRAMVMVTPSSDGWSFLWNNGGIADASEPSIAADQIARSLA